MRYRIIGTTQLLNPEGTAVAVGGARLRALLTVLALRPGRTVPVGLLVDEVWNGEPPADAAGALQALVGRLRRAVGHTAIASVEGGGYRLDAEPDDIDLYRFERLAGDGARALEQGDPAKALTRLDDALALWTGPVLADLPDRTAEAARWEARRLDARRARLAAALALGRADEALPELAALCAAHPLDEPLHALRIRALRAAGRTAEALAAYEDVRRTLADRLGADPGPELRSLHGELLHTPEAPVAVEAPAAARPAAPGNLRARLTSFVGREADIEAIRGDLGGARLVTLLGPGGAGKTRLSQEAAEAVGAAGDGWPDGVWLAELAPVADPAAVPAAVLTSVGARETVLHGAGAEELRAVDRTGGDPLVHLAAHCERRRMLLLLDNCEHVIGAAAELAEYLLARCPGLTVLATSREPLGVPGELVRPVEPLPAPVALRLLADRGAAARPGFRVEDDPGAAAEICRRLDGLPLAVELAAARLRMLTPRQIADRLDDRFRLLTSGSRTVLPRQQTLRAVVDWSWDLLEAPERTVLRRLSVFAGGCDLAAAEEVCADGPAGVAALDVAPLLGSLVDKSLVVAAPGNGGEMRYRLLETVAEYAAERLDGAGDRGATERRHLVHYRELARTTDPELRGGGQRAAVDLLEREYENLRTALRRAVDLADEQEVLCMVHALASYWHMRDLRGESRRWSEAAAELGPDPFAPPAEPAPPVFARCTDSPPPMEPEVLQEARRGVRLFLLVSMDHAADDWTTPEARERLHTIVGVYRPGLPQTCRMPGALWFFPVVLISDVDKLRELLDATVRACEEFGYEWELANALQMRANVLANRSDWAGEATRDADAGLVIYRRLGDDWGAAEALSARGEARERRGEYGPAAEDYTEAVRYAERLGAQAQVSLLKARLASVLLETGEGERGEAMLREILAAGRQAGYEAQPAARMFLAMWLGRTERVPEAREQIALMLEEFKSSNLALFEGFVLGIRAWLENLEGAYGKGLADARAALARAVEPMARMVAPQMIPVHLLSVAWAWAGLAEPGAGRAADAARLIGAHDTLLPPVHFATPMEAELRAKVEALVRPLLDGAAYDAAYAEGGGLSLEEAAALAQRERD
ncbi:BTAD domain-containing putative transcriptional regulator [Streptomyces sp. BPTC-684]|uniref:BTAD domain-containing putative transcriptional regulator n=1 Tax=Streptomyces sp. BPTC-684 TaxID=3043734 RepID=UPI0024B0641F|nr:BTAD domain-containing putative transcriptional regulator [Streptomyces sp. BPTC-684]WHM38965.1 BTAD domain-containing putative transcriptional regulator [Streptomyces sp. BPTC-684]